MFTTIITFVIILGLLIFVHEFGHFITAKKMGVRVDEFGFGFPPRIFGIKKGGTIYSINWIPLGGFVKIKGEAGGVSSDPDSFANKKAWQKISILSAGVTMNFVLAFLLFSLGFMIGMPQEVTDDEILNKSARDVQIIIAEIAPDSPAEIAGIKIGDSLLSINNTNFQNTDEIFNYIADNQTSELSLRIKRGSDEVDYLITPALYGDNDTPLLGIGMIRAGLVKLNFFEAIYQGFVATIGMIILVIMALATILRDIFTGAGLGGQISGPVGVAILTGQVSRLGLSYIINFTAMLSINLGILNIFPFPALDGGRIIFVILEKLKRKPINPKIENVFHNIGFSLLILLIVFITYKDIIRYGNDILSGILGIFN